MSRNFYVHTSVKFMFANKIEAMHEGSLVSVTVEPRSTSRLSSVPERPISANPGLRFCSTFLYLLSYTLLRETFNFV